MTMKICTKKKFLDTFCRNCIVYVGTFFHESDEWVANALERIEPRCVFIFYDTTVEIRNDYIVFSNGGRLSFEQEGNYTFYEHLGKNGIYFMVCRHEFLDKFDGKTYRTYTVYAIPDLCINAGLKVQEAVDKIASLRNKCMADKAKKIGEFGNAENRNYFVQGLNKALEIIGNVFE